MGQWKQRSTVREALVRITALVVVALVSGCANCGPGPGPGPRPDLPTYAGAVGAELVAPQGHGSPMIVDWPPEARADLEVTMHQNVAVVSYSGKGMRLLTDCHIKGNYGYVGISRKEQVVRLQSSAEIKANLTTGALGLLGKIGGELERGTTLDVALVIVGARRTTYVEVTEQELQGKCAGATHFVRGALIGAFAMQTGSRGRAAAVAEVFGIGGGATGSSEKSVQTKDGDLRSCDQSEPGNDTPPSKCSALVRLQLSPISKGKSSEQERNVNKAGAETDVCADGFVLQGGKCTPKTQAQEPYACKIGEVDECKAQCEKGNGDSCGVFAALYSLGFKVPRDLNAALTHAKRGCDLRSDIACDALAGAALWGEGMPKDPGLAARLFGEACQHGLAWSCASLSSMYATGNGVTKDLKRAADLGRQACDAGAANGCFLLGSLHHGGLGVARDLRRSAAYSRRACEGGFGYGCSSLAALVEFGRGTPQDLEEAGRLLVKGCELLWVGCGEVAKFMLSRPSLPTAIAQVPKNWTPKWLLENACQHHSDEACGILNALYKTGPAPARDQLQFIVEQYQDTCQADDALACSYLGTSTYFLGDRARADKTLERACSLGDPWACYFKKQLPPP